MTQAELTIREYAFGQMNMLRMLGDEDAANNLQEAINTAIAALRDMLKRREGCYACREEQPYCDDSGWWAMYEGDALRLSAKGDEHCIASPFCINCGRQLAKEGGDETKSVEVEG